MEGFVVLTTCVLLLSLTWSHAVQNMIVSNDVGTRCRTIDLLYFAVKATTVGVSLFMSLLFKFADFRTYMSDCMILAFREFSDIRVWLAVLLCSLGAFLSLVSTAAASKFCLMKPGVQAPMFLCPVFAVFITTAVWNDFETQAFWEVAGEDLYSWIALGLSTVAWLIPFIMPSFHGFNNPSACGRNFTDIFYSFSWNCFFLEPRLILIYDPSMTSDNQPSLPSKQAPHCRSKIVYICTTMYKESAKEMKRYLGSIKKVFTHKSNEELTLEAHIFFDSAIDNNKINSRGQRLIYLLCEIFQKNNDDLEKLATPYGCQIRTKTSENYDVYVHFKDAFKVKAKKRWSQVMYMHYILQFRTLQMMQHLSENCLFIQSKQTQQCKKECQQQLFLVGNYTGFHSSAAPNSLCVDVKYLTRGYTCASTITPRNIDYLPLRPSEITEHCEDVSDPTNCYCSDCTSGSESIQRNDANERGFNKSTYQLDSASCFVFSEDYLRSVKKTEQLRPMHPCSKIFFPTDDYCGTCSSSSDVCR